MILEELVMDNFGLYRGRQVLDLRPVEESGRPRPIILFGGLNGGGKTTLLDAILLALYGRRAECSKRNGQGYDEFLRDSINYAASPQEGACISLKFRYFREGKEDHYEVSRNWHANGDGVKESLDVRCNGESDRYLSDRWKQLVEDLIPTGLSRLFFFDAEQIRRLAEDDTSLKSLGGAVKSLLGLDIVESLIADAETMSRSHAKSALPQRDVKEIEELQTAIKRIEQELAEKKTLLASERNTFLRAEELLRREEQEFSIHGGDLHRKRDVYLHRQTELQTKESHLRNRLHELSAGQLPLLLVEDMLRGVHKAHTQQSEARNNAILLKELRARDKAMLAWVEDTAKTPRKLVTRLEQWLQEDQKRREPNAVANASLELSDRSANRLASLLNEGIENLRTETKAILENLQSVVTEMEDIERLLAVSPKEADLAEATKRLLGANRKHAASKAQVEQMESEIERLSKSIDHLKGRLGRLLQRKMEIEHGNEDAARVAQLSGRTVKTMREFLRRSTALKIDKLAQSITEAFQFLLRKKSLVHRVQIDPTTFSVDLSGPDGGRFPKQRLSEGEKQLFAIAVLWGLARTSGRPLPAIIDTPMARLDSNHRTNLIDRYFPHASHQVIILSTDTEVDREYYRLLKPHVARSYALEYHEKDKFTQVKPGYFWE